MSNRRYEFDTLLRQTVGSSGKCNVYFQPPESIKLSYPCIVYSFTTADTKYSNDKTYLFTHGYDVIYITKEPDDSMVDTLAYTFPMCMFTRQYISDNLYHYVYRIYY